MKVLQVESGNSFRMGEAGFHVLAPAKDALGEDVNEEGMVVELNYRSFRGLFYRRCRRTYGKNNPVQAERCGFFEGGASWFPLFVLSGVSGSGEGRDSSDLMFRFQYLWSSVPGNNTPPEKIRGKNRIYHENGAITVCTDGKKLRVERFDKRINSMNL